MPPHIDGRAAAPPLYYAIVSQRHYYFATPLLIATLLRPTPLLLHTPRWLLIADGFTFQAIRLIDTRRRLRHKAYADNMLRDIVDYYATLRCLLRQMRLRHYALILRYWYGEGTASEPPDAATIITPALLPLLRYEER